MKIVVHQAIFGELNKGWDLLATTENDSESIRNLRFKTDIHDKPPDGLVWTSITRGFLLNKHYLITKTYPDTSPNVRTGRVFSHSLLIKRSDLKHIKTIEVLFPFFKKEADKSIDIEPIIFDTNLNTRYFVKDRLKPRFNKIIHGIAESAKYNNTIVWVGLEHFEEAICGTWSLLSLKDKEKFSFGINYNYKEITNTGFNLVAIPATFENKWRNTPYCIVKSSDSYKLENSFELYIAGDEKTLETITKFIEEIEADNLNKTDISYISKILPTYENINNIKDFKKLRVFYQVVAKFSPDKHKGKEIKSKILLKFADSIKQATAPEILSLKNSSVKYYVKGKTAFCTALKYWGSENLFSEKSSKDNEFISILKEVLNSKREPSWWHQCLRKELNNFLKKISVKKSKIVWGWITKDLSILEVLINRIDNSSASETAFFDTFPRKLPQETILEVRKFSLINDWLKLYAKTLVEELDFENAIEEQLKIDNNEDYFDSVRVIVNSAKPK